MTYTMFLSVHLINYGISPSQPETFVTRTGHTIEKGMDVSNIVEQRELIRKNEGFGVISKSKYLGLRKHERISSQTGFL